MQCTVEYRWMTRSQAGEGSTMEERLDMETERSGIVSANATVRRRRRFSNIEMKRKLERWYCRCIWVSSILCGLAAVIIITAAVREISCNASSIPFYKKIKPWRQNRNCVCSLTTAQTQFFLKVKNRHHLAAAAEALVKSGANGKREVQILRIYAKNLQQGQRLKDCGATKVKTRVEEPAWIDLSRSSKSGELSGFLERLLMLEWRSSCWPPGRPTGLLVIWQQPVHCIAMQCIPSTHNLTPFWIQSCCAFHFSYLTLSHMTLSTIWPSHILVHPSTFLSCFHLVQASVLPRTRSNAGPLRIASLPFPPASLFTNITPEIKVMSSDSNMGQDVFLFHDARQMCVLPQMGAGFVANFLI